MRTPKKKTTKEKKSSKRESHIENKKARARKSLKKKMGGGCGGVVLKLACAGLPSAGKSTMINALAGARFLETGVCRTTSAPCVLSARCPNGPTGPTGPTGLACE